MTTYDIMMLDFDEGDGNPKDSAVEVLERFLSSQAILPENERISKSEVCFKIYETDNGIHAWPISHFFPHQSIQAIRMFLETCSDKMYASFSYVQGFSIRMSPKLFTNSYERIRRSQEEIDRQFVQKEGYKGTLYVGNRDNINPYIEEFVDMIFKIQQFVLKYDNVIDRIERLDDELFIETSRYAINLFENMENQRNESKPRKWASNPLACAEMRKIDL
jgi:hypothetical protein